MLLQALKARNDNLDASDPKPSEIIASRRRNIGKKLSLLEY